MQQQQLVSKQHGFLKLQLQKAASFRPHTHHSRYLFIYFLTHRQEKYYEQNIVFPTQNPLKYARNCEKQNNFKKQKHTLPAKIFHMHVNYLKNF